MWEGGGGGEVRICALARPTRQKYACTPIPLSIFTPQEYSLGKFSLPPTLHSYQIQDDGLHTCNMITLCIRTTLHLSYISEIQESRPGTSVYDTITYFSHMLCRTPQYSVGVANHSESPGPMLIFIA